MDLAQRCRSAFGSRDWQRGAEYARQDAVEFVAVRNESLDAEVQGSESYPYDVQLDWSDVPPNALRGHCSCPRFQDVGECKHLTAVIQAANRDLELAVPGTGALRFEPMWREIDDEPDDSIIEAGPMTWAESASFVRKLSQPAAKRKAPKIEPWMRQLSTLQALQWQALREAPSTQAKSARAHAELWFLLDLQETRHLGVPCIRPLSRAVKKNGQTGKLRAARLSEADVAELPSAEDRALAGLLIGNQPNASQWRYYERSTSWSDFLIRPGMFEVLLPRLCASGRLLVSPDGYVGAALDNARPLAWDDGPAWRFCVSIEKSGRNWDVHGRLIRENELLELHQVAAYLPSSLILLPGRFARIDASGYEGWLALLRLTGSLRVPLAQEAEFAEQLALLPPLPEGALPEGLQSIDGSMPPLPCLKIGKSSVTWETNLECRLTYAYGERQALPGELPVAWYDRATRTVIRRDPAAESAAIQQLKAAGARAFPHAARGVGAPFKIAPDKAPKLIQRLASAGWRIEAEGKSVRQSGALSIKVSSAVDWFDLDAKFDFDGESVSLPRLLAAAEQGSGFVVLSDGSQAMLPEGWLKRFGALAALGKAEGERLRFAPSQAMLLDALVAEQEASKPQIDESFARLRERLREFRGIAAHEAPASFQGQLRPYQQEGLGWLRFLDEFGFGGCLADDMGLGKTVQVLAMLEARREQRAASQGAKSRKNGAAASGPGPSLVVVPRSLVFNWIEEARRFAPQLRALNYTGLERRAAFDEISGHDLVVTTYGTLRRDVAQLREIEFDYAILDEAQAIKNASSQAAKACRLLRARRRLAMTGTPVENHLGELWSLFEFLNPGMLGRQSSLNRLVADAGTRGAPPSAGSPEGGGLALLGRALRPFLLRRTKQQVLADLPEKTEQTLYCELDREQRELYDELREHYRASLLERVAKVGVKQSKIHVLEALLRLRQAACHPGLLDKKRVGRDSAKLETLLEQLSEVLAEGHKALVFSQFTSLLAIVRRHLDQRRVIYEYLDGRTTKRQQHVERFQTDPECKLFLISLKAGGQGLNLTAADYVFILDPWWNPAAEAQAVDRAHRIGQQRHVMAYRLIARDTIEEKILELQDQKRDLAEAIISADNSLLRNLTAEDLQLLLS